MTVLVSIVVMLSTIALLAFVLDSSTAATANDRYASFVPASGIAPAYDEPQPSVAELPAIAPADATDAPPSEPEPVVAHGTRSTSTSGGRVAFSITPDVLQPKWDGACLRTPGGDSTAGARCTFVLELGTHAGADGTSVRASGRQATDMDPRRVRFTSTEYAPARPRRLTTCSTSSTTRSWAPQRRSKRARTRTRRKRGGSAT